MTESDSPRDDPRDLPTFPGSSSVNRSLSSANTTGSDSLRNGSGDGTTFSASFNPSSSFANYRLLQPIGEGGMGEVWLAEQTQPVRRKLAIKLIKAGMDTRQVVARFEAERQALAVMDHPAIAKVFDGGSTPEGRPFFAMEVVHGEAITAYCNRHQPPLRQRLFLFLHICDAVQHAHQKGIIHRDLKPSNVLVEVIDGRAYPKVIDFGIAKATAQTLTDRTLYTELGTVMGTPEYMSPEQADPSGPDIDTRTDVYSLGAILYELLTGALALDMTSARQGGLDEVCRMIRDAQPMRPSLRAPALAHELRGDLDWIALRALEKDRTRRYGSVSDLAEDIRRHLDHQPVTARPPTIGYRSAKFLRRHRLGVSIAAAGITLLLTFAVAMAVQAQRIAKERDRANLEAAAAKQTSAFLTGLFTVTDPSEARGNTLTANQILDRGAAEIDQNLIAQPEVRARLQVTIGTVYTNLGRYSAAEPLLKQAEATFRALGGPDDPSTLSAIGALANLLWYQDRYAEAEGLYTQIADAQRRSLGPNSRETLKTEFDLASTYAGQGRLDDAIRLTSEVLDRQRNVLGPEDLDTVETGSNLSSFYWMTGQHDKALPLAELVLRVHERISGPDHPATLNAMHNLATRYDHLDRFAEAESLYRRAIDARRRIQGSDHPLTAATQLRYGQMLQRQRRFEDAEVQVLAAHKTLSRSGSGVSSQRTGLVVDQLVSLYTDWGKPTLALQWRATMSPQLR